MLAITVYAGALLVLGRPMKSPYQDPLQKNWRYRVLGVLALSIWPVMAVAVIGAGVLFTMENPGLSPEEAEEAFDMQWTWPLAAIEVIVAALYGGFIWAGCVWIKRVVERLGRGGIEIEYFDHDKLPRPLPPA